MRTIFEYINLQLFADAGTLVNGTGNFVNAYDGTTTPFDAAHTMDGELKTFYDTELLENARVELFYAQFAKKQTLPKKHGKTVEWRGFNTFEKATKLQEGVIPTGQKFGMRTKTGSIEQYGTYAAVTDILELRAYDDVILGATEEMGASAAETQETLIRDALLVNVVYLLHFTKVPLVCVCGRLLPRNNRKSVLHSLSTSGRGNKAQERVIYQKQPMQASRKIRLCRDGCGSPHLHQSLSSSEVCREAL